MITFKFYEQCKLKKVKTIKLETYKDFFDFFVQNSEKGCIYDVKEIGKTK
jgi:hypothetical protein